MDTMTHQPALFHPLDGSSLRVTFSEVTRAVRASWLLEALALLLAADLAFALVEIAVIITDYGFPGAYRLSLQTDGLGLAEIYGYSHELLVFGILTDAALRLRSAVAWFWSAVILYIFIDDAIQIHEHIGGRLARSLGFSDAGSLRAQDLGELALYVVVGVVAVTALVTVERHTGDGVDSLTLLLVPLVGLFAFFAVGVDMLLSTRFSSSVEDGGELLALSLILIAAAGWWWHRDRYEA